MGSRDEELGHNVELTADLVNSSVELKFFPEAPAEKDAVNRVSSSFQSLIWYYLLCAIACAMHQCTENLHTQCICSF